MNIDLNGRTAIVTGSTEDIGYATAKTLAASGTACVSTIPLPDHKNKPEYGYE